MTPEGKKALLDSKWRTSPELKKKHEEENKRIEETNKEIYGELGHKSFLQGMASAMAAEDNLGYGSTDPEKISMKDKEQFKLVQDLEDSRNKKVIEKIMADDLQRRRAEFAPEEQQRAQELSKLDEKEIDKMLQESVNQDNGYGNPLLKVFLEGKDSSLDGFNKDEKVKYLAMQ